MGWRGLWAYITAAPPRTALHYAQAEGWALSDKIAANQLHALRVLVWRYTAMHFEGGKDQPFPEPVDYPGSKPSEPELEVVTTISPQVRALMQEGA